MVEKQEERGGTFGWLRKVDDAVFAAEQSIVAFALITITAVIFVDVVARRITSPDSRVGELLAKIAQIDDIATRDWIGQNVAPYVTVVASLLLVGFAVFSGRRFARRRAKVEEPPRGRELGIAAGVAVATLAGGYVFALVFEQLESWMVYAAVFSLSSIGVIVYNARKQAEGWKVRAAVSAVAGALLVWFALSYVPEGYTWSKKVSLMLVLWVGMLSASICVYAGKHIRIEAASKLVPPKVEPYVKALSGVGGAAFCALMAYLGFRYVFALEANDDEYMEEAFNLFGTRYVYSFQGMIGRGGMLEGTEIPDWVGILAAPIGFGIATLRFLGFSASSITGGDYGAAAAEEGMEEAKAAASGKETADAEANDSGEATDEPTEVDADEPADAPEDDASEADPPDDTPPKKAKKKASSKKKTSKKKSKKSRRSK